MYTKILNHLRDLSAEEDSNFSRHFISTRYNKRILSDHSDIIFGTKGTGKTALSIALTEFDKDNFLNTYILDLNTLSFQRLLNNLKELEEMINEDINIISRIAWKNTLLNAAILSLSEKLNNDEDLKFKIISILNEDGFIQNSSDRKDSDEKVNSILENLFSKITNAIFVKKGISNLSSSQVNAINKFPLNEKTSKILNTIIEKVFSTGKKILVTIDGLDSISDHSFESRNVIFTGLIDAIYHLRIDKNIKKAF